MIQEQFPVEVDFQTEHTRMEFQGNALTCTCFGVTSAWEAMLHRIGRLEQLSPRFLWWLVRGKNPGVEVNAAAVEANGICLEELCPYIVDPNYPYAVIDLYATPSGEALADAKTRLPKGIKPKLITTGKEGVMRALAKGSAITIIKMLGGGLEHCAAIIGYNSFGVKVHDSGNNIYYQPWSDLLNGVITQLWCWEGLPLVPHPDYIEGDIPSLIDGVLSLPKAMVYVGFPNPSIHFKNVVLQMVTPGWLTQDNDDVQDIVFWHSAKMTLYIPKLLKDSVLMRNVKIVGPTATLISGEQL
jgi:hypothetical protein